MKRLKNRLFINYSKTKFLLFNKTAIKKEFSVKVNGFEIEQSESIKYLGVVLGDKLNWKAHLKCLKAKLLRIVLIVKIEILFGFEYFENGVL